LRIILHIISLTNSIIAQQLYALQRAAYQIESQLIDYPHLPPLRESFTEFQQAGEQWLTWIEQQEIMGALAFVLGQDSLDICRLVVSPNHFRKGIARQLLLGLEPIALGAQTLTVSTAARNEPAIKLYYSQGYQLIRQSITPDGLELVHLQKKLTKL
jgi:ribosomal protein S18 acetylase RimI-like enzyme